VVDACGTELLVVVTVACELEPDVVDVVVELAVLDVDEHPVTASAATTPSATAIPVRFLI
jgi:hypothetical protein